MYFYVVFNIEWCKNKLFTKFCFHYFEEKNDRIMNSKPYLLDSLQKLVEKLNLCRSYKIFRKTNFYFFQNACI